MATATETSPQDLSEELKTRLERMAQELETEREKRREAEKRAKAKESEQDLTVLSASKDLWRGVDEDRPNRPDTVRISPAERKAQQSRPSEQEMLEAAVARQLSARES